MAVGDIEVRGTGGDVNIDTRKSDIKVSDTKGNIKFRPRLEKSMCRPQQAGLTVDGSFTERYGRQNSQGRALPSRRTDLTLVATRRPHGGQPGQLENSTRPGNLSVRTQDDITLENAGGKVKVDIAAGT